MIYEKTRMIKNLRLKKIQSNIKNDRYCFLKLNYLSSRFLSRLGNLFLRERERPKGEKRQ